MVNPVPPAQGDDGKATPPPVAGFPPKYTQAHFEEVRNNLYYAILHNNFFFFVPVCVKSLFLSMHNACH